VAAMVVFFWGGEGDGKRLAGGGANVLHCMN